MSANANPNPMQKETDKLLRQFRKGGVEVTRVTRWRAVSGRERLDVWVKFPSGQEVQSTYVFKFGKWVFVA